MCMKCSRGAASVEIVTLIFADPAVCGHVLNIFFVTFGNSVYLHQKDVSKRNSSGVKQLLHLISSSMYSIE